MELSVVICTFNGAQKLPGLLHHLRRQKQVSDFAWEIVIVDNNSTDDTAAVVHACQQNWPQDRPLQYLFEPKQGLAFARRCAIANVSSAWVGFLDDDTEPDENWVEAVWQFAQTHPEAGAIGSAIAPIFEVPPPDGFERIASLFAIIERGDTPFVYAQHPGVLPAGAGMAIRREAWLAHVPQQPILTGVSTTSLSSKGEDVETLSYIRDGGWEVWHNPAMQISHHLPASRLKPDYMLKICHAVGINRFPLRMARYCLWQRPLMLLVYGLNDFRKFVIYSLKHARSINSDIISACEFVLFRDTCFGPFYYLLGYLRLK